MKAPGITPGDWHADSGRQPQIASEADPKGRTLALVYDLPDEAETAANAVAIAALPRLLAACLKTLDVLEGMTSADFSLGKDHEARDALTAALVEAGAS